MSNFRHCILTIICTYILTRFGYWFFQFDPMKLFSGWHGWAIDMLIGLTIYIISYLLIGKLASKSE